uniref:Ubiquitin-activating enzyme E1 C-terminal domain-containing protein n=1 Tax=Gadus morhua TaxID=8049 RepID=A0A8C4ZW71_GADMO
MAADSMEIDDSLYSRQRYVLGDTAMQKMAQSSVFLSGMGGLGIEIAKNIVLAGVKTVTLHDTKQCEVWDLGINFFIRQDDVFNQRTRVEAVFPRIVELNPYVHVEKSSSTLDDNTDLSFLRKYQVRAVVRLGSFISCSAHGICVRVFCDFGDDFEVSDPTGEEPKEIFIQSITQGSPGVVTCMDNRPHGLQNGQSVLFREVNGMQELNGSTRPVTVLSPHSFSIEDTSHLRPYAHGGFFALVKTPMTFSFAPLQIHAAMLALDTFQEHESQYGLNLPRSPTARCAPSSYCGTLPVNPSSQAPVNAELVRCLSRTARGALPPLAAAVGGLASQEALKALTGKFSPLQQWVGQPVHSLPVEEFSSRGDRYDGLRACIGESMCLELHKLRVFMVGCGAIGCEMLKNFAMLGVGLAKCSGEVFITDPDLIEKSNLNRQFLFRPYHIQKPKSSTAAAATLEINPELQVDAHLHKVCPATEGTYSDAFYSRLHLVVTALDNVEARRYVDSRSVSNQKALLDSGTMGTKGHTEIIVPNLTESYNSHRDPPEEEIPFCTLKSFPAVIEHTIQWARDKFESGFTQKPSTYNLFWQTHSSVEAVLQRMQSRESLEGAFQVIKLLSKRPSQWEHCIILARLKFEKYFKKKALQLLHSFPLDTRLKDGSKYTNLYVAQSRPTSYFMPHLIRHTWLLSCVSTAGLIHMTYQPLDCVCVSFQPIETDESAKKPDQQKLALSSEEEREAITQLEGAIAARHWLQVSPMQFEKDDDANGHMDFVASASALRARMYAIEAADRLKTKRIAGKIIPAIATSTAAVAGLVALELIKVVGGYGFESFKNCFFNLAIPVVVLTETAPVKRTHIRDNISFSIWDRWTIYGHDTFTLSDFISAVKEKYGIEPTMVVHGVKMLYVPVMPGHNKRLKLTMHKLIKPPSERRYVDLTVSFVAEADEDEDRPGPPIRYHLHHTD